MGQTDIEIELSRFATHFHQLPHLKYAFIKEGSGVPIFFLHGFPDHAGSWDGVISKLSTSFTCIAPYLRGYYPTEIPLDRNYSVYEIAKDIHELAVGLKYSEYHVVGSDWGATIAYVMANLYPKNVRSILTMGMPHPRFLKPNPILLIKARHVLYLGNSKKAAARLSKNNYSYLEKLYKRWSPAHRWTTLKEQMVTCFNAEGYKEAALGYYWAILKDGKREERKLLYNALPEVPAIVLVGEKDGAIDLGQFRKMEQDSSFMVKYHPDGGHFLHREDEDFCVENIKNLLML